MRLRVCGALGLAVSAISMHAFADTPTRFSFSTGERGSAGYLGPCQVAAVVVTLDPSVVPEPFVPIMVAGRAAGAIASLDCPVGVDGAPPSPSKHSEIIVFVESADGSPGPQGYQLTLPGTNPHVQRRLQAFGMGVFAQKVPGLTFTRSGSIVIDVHSDVPWTYSPYSISSRITAPLLPGAANGTLVGWHKGTHGILRFVYDARQLSAGEGVGTVTATPDSALAAWLGAASITGAAALLNFDATVTVDLCGASVDDCPPLP